MNSMPSDIGTIAEIRNALDWTYAALGAERHEQPAQLHDREAVGHPRLIDTSLLVTDGQSRQAITCRAHKDLRWARTTTND